MAGASWCRCWLLAIASLRWDAATAFAASSVRLLLDIWDGHYKSRLLRQLNRKHPCLFWLQTHAILLTTKADSSGN